jgi:hypothetical protein
MIVSRGRFWRASLQKRSVAIQIQRVSLPEDLVEAREAHFDVPLKKWNRLLKNIHADRKLLGGLLLDFARKKDRVGVVVESDRLLAEFRRCVLDATVVLVEEEILVLSQSEGQEEG